MTVMTRDDWGLQEITRDECVDYGLLGMTGMTRYDKG